MEYFANMSGYVWVVAAILTGMSLLLAVLWMILPFSIFGVKRLLRDMLGRLEMIEKHLDKMSGKVVDLNQSETQNVAGSEQPTPQSREQDYESNG